MVQSARFSTDLPDNFVADTNFQFFYSKTIFGCRFWSSLFLVDATFFWSRVNVLNVWEKVQPPGVLNVYRLPDGAYIRVWMREEEVVITVRRVITRGHQIE